MSFKLLAIRPLEGCSDNVRKNLKVDEFYFFDNSYERYENSDYIVKKKNATDLPNGFFLQQNTESSLEYINVQAIVGMNGSGKSAIAELLLGTLNNIFKYVSTKIDNDIDLTYVLGLSASLYFQVNNEGYVSVDVCGERIKVNIFNNESELNESLILYDFLNDIAKPSPEEEPSSNLNLSKEEIQFLKNIFFTMYINYSLYGLDDQDFKQKEDKYVSELQLDGSDETVQVSWLTKIFHKNDGYQTPLVIHPYRKNAMINVRNEKHLMENRLAVLLFTNPEYRTIIPDYEFETVGFYLKEFSFNKIVNDILDQNFLKKTGEEFINLSDISKFDNFSINDIDTLVNYLAKWIEQNETLLSQVESINKFRNNRKVSKDIRSFGKVLYAIRGIFLDPLDSTNKCNSI